MSIGTSMGAYYDDAFHQAAAQWDPDQYEDNVVTPDSMMKNKSDNSDPNNIYDDSGKLVDYGNPMYDKNTNDILKQMRAPDNPHQTMPDK